ncbi:MAG: hypothetical protein AABX38_02645 [Candidatus Micrarchaeota archaeon]
MSKGNVFLEHDRDVVNSSSVHEHVREDASSLQDTSLRPDVSSWPCGS